MILSECTLEETELSLECKGSVFVHTELSCRCRKVLDCIVDVLEHVLHDYLTIVSWIIKSLISRSELHVNPWNISESLYLLEIEVSSEELCKSCIFLYGSLILTVIDITEESVHLSEVAPRPAAS